MKNLVSGENRLQGVLGGDIITFLKGILIKEIIKSVNILWIKSISCWWRHEHHFTTDTSSIYMYFRYLPYDNCQKVHDFCQILAPKLVNRQMMQLLVSLRIIGLSSETHMENSLFYDQNIFTSQGLTICSSPL